jgi:hypothetical protein
VPLPLPTKDDAQLSPNKKREKNEAFQLRRNNARLQRELESLKSKAKAMGLNQLVSSNATDSTGEVSADYLNHSNSRNQLLSPAASHSNLSGNSSYFIQSL